MIIRAINSATNALATAVKNAPDSVRPIAEITIVRTNVRLAKCFRVILIYSRS